MFWACSQPFPPPCGPFRTSFKPVSELVLGLFRAVSDLFFFGPGSHLFRTCFGPVSDLCRNVTDLFRKSPIQTHQRKIVRTTKSTKSPLAQQNRQHKIANAKSQNNKITSTQITTTTKSPPQNHKHEKITNAAKSAQKKITSATFYRKINSTAYHHHKITSATKSPTNITSAKSPA